MSHHKYTLTPPFKASGPSGKKRKSSKQGGRPEKKPSRLILPSRDWSAKLGLSRVDYIHLRFIFHDYERLLMIYFNIGRLPMGILKKEEMESIKQKVVKFDKEKMDRFKTDANTIKKSLTNEIVKFNKQKEPLTESEKNTLMKLKQWKEVLIEIELMRVHKEM